MASIKSLGIHTPSALGYLIAEGLLPAHPPRSAYTWQRYPIPGSVDSYDEEELLITDSAVVWSRGDVVQKLFRFDMEGEPVRQALFVTFKDDKVSRPTKPAKRAKTEYHTLSPSLAIRKRPQANTEPAGIYKSPRAGTWAYAERGGDSTSTASKEDDRRALVVLLKRQMHVFFLTGDMHLVPLPFPVATVFALPSGLAIQREMAEDDPLELFPPVPPAPYNSFAASQATVPVSFPSQTQEQPAVVLKMLAKVLSPSEHSRSSTLPAHFYLRDPIADLEPLGESMQSESASSLAVSSQPPRKLDQNERLLYVSAQDELSRRSPPSRGASLLLAVTVNPVSGYYSIWKFSEQKHKRSRRHLQALSTSKDKVRASFGPGTGATTPVARKSFGARESFGQPRDSRDRSFAHDDADIASQLDPAFENPGAPSRSSRRISSLIARSEMHGGRDNTNAADLTSSHSQVGGARRGSSFGGRSSRKSFGSFGQEQPRRRGSSSNTERDELKTLDDDDTMADSDEPDNSPPPEPPLASLIDTKRFVLSRVCTLRADTLRGKERSYKDLLASHRVFTFGPPAGVSETDSLRLCIMSHINNTFHVFQVGTSRLRTPTHAARTPQTLDVRVSHASSSPNIRDVCLIQDSLCSRIIILRTSAKGADQLSLQSPWSPSLNFSLPSKLFTANPYRIELENATRKRRNGEFKRVLSGGPDELRCLHPAAASAQFSVEDSEGVYHRIQLCMSPRDALVQRALLVCEYAMPNDPAAGELLLRIWWELMSSLAEKNGSEDDLEWRAFVATMFTLFVPFLDKAKEAKPARTKRKGGLLRSSSGANMDLESFEEAMARECPPGAATAAWLQSESWSWVLDTDASLESPASSQQKKRRSTSSTDGTAPEIIRKRTLISECLEAAQNFVQSAAGNAAFVDPGYMPVSKDSTAEMKHATLRNVVIALHFLREELKLDVIASQQLHALTPLLAQLGTWLGWGDWNTSPTSFYMLEAMDMERWSFDQSTMHLARDIPQLLRPPSILQFVEDAYNGSIGEPFPTLADYSGRRRSANVLSGVVRQLTPRTALLIELLQFQDSGPTSFIRIIGDSNLTSQILETLPEGVAAPLRSVIVSCQANPGASLPPRVLDLIDRPDLSLLSNNSPTALPQAKHFTSAPHEASRDFNAICRSTLEPDPPTTHEGSAEEDRSVVTKLLFSQDQRFGEAAMILHPLKFAMAKCIPEPEWTDTDLLEAQQELAKVVAWRTLSVSPGRAMLYYNARFPLLTEKFPIHGFSLSCLMKPGNTTVTADKTIYTEEKVSWAFFHAGVEAGLSIAKGAKGIDTSWISYNKPPELGNRHAGFLLALGLNGHLKSIAKWVAFKYLTPKHTMTSIGLLLGLAASYLGTMDTLITRLLSVHVVRMLPVGAAEMNLSPLTQTTGIMGIGLLYCNTQHRRMSEVMLSEIENTEQDDSISPMENLRDEGYRLAAGFALGYINLGQGRELKGMRDMHIVERLLTLAVATKRVGLVHILDKATAAAVVATALIFMKTEDRALAKKIDIPDTVHQFEYVRPDLFLIRTVARHLIMWKGITPTFAWIKAQLPLTWRDRFKLNHSIGLRSDHLPLFNIVAGLCLSIGLRFAGSAREDVRDLLGHYLDAFMKIVSLVGASYDEKLTRISVRNCQDVVALAAAAVMAGTGDIFLLKRFRVLHGRTDPDTHYGSHLAAHQAIGVLFLGGGTHTFNTSNLGVASLLCAFYPLFPTSVLDNKCHLQAFRHFWVFATEPRCLVVRSVETRRPMNVPITITLQSGAELTKTAPCLLPELDRIARISSADPRYWPVTLDFATNPSHLAAFREHQSLYVRQRGTYNQGLSVFSATMRALNERQTSFQRRRDAFEWLFALQALSGLDRATRHMVLPVDSNGYPGDVSGKGTAVDDRLALEHGCLPSARAERLWSLRVLFAWEDKMQRVGNHEIAWLGAEAIASLRAQVALRGREGAAS